MADFDLDAILGNMKAEMSSVGTAASSGDFKGVCTICMRSVFNDDGVNTGEKMYHKSCLVCAVCHSNLSASPFYLIDGKPHCEPHYMALNYMTCAVCIKPITVELVEALGKHYHPECMACAECGKPLAGARFVPVDGKLICEQDYQAKSAATCSACQNKILTAEFLKVGEDRFHTACFSCKTCKVAFGMDKKAFKHEGVFYCDTHYTLRKAGKLSSLE